MHKARTIYPSKKIQTLLRKVRPEQYDESTLVFPAPKTGSYINDNNLSTRIWTRTLQRAGIPHRKLYNTRSTFISHALASGASPAKVAEIVGDESKLFTDIMLAIVMAQRRFPILVFSIISCGSYEHSQHKLQQLLRVTQDYLDVNASL